jgi:hypothetical protein
MFSIPWGIVILAFEKHLSTMNKHLIPAFLFLFSTIPGQAQFKFGVAAGYEHTNIYTPYETIPWNSLKPDAFTCALITTTPINENLELHADLSFANWSASYTIEEQGGPRGVPLPPIIYQGKTKITHIVLPVSICYTLPVKEARFFAGVGLFLSDSHYDDPSSSITCFGPNFTAGIRLKWGLVFMADFRPVFWGSKGESYSPNAIYPIQKPTSDFAFKLGYQFWKKKHQS